MIRLLIVAVFSITWLLPTYVQAKVFGCKLRSPEAIVQHLHNDLENLKDINIDLGGDQSYDNIVAIPGRAPYLCKNQEICPNKTVAGAELFIRPKEQFFSIIPIFGIGVEIKEDTIIHACGFWRKGQAHKTHLTLHFLEANTLDGQTSRDTKVDLKPLNVQFNPLKGKLSVAGKIFGKIPFFGDALGKLFEIPTKIIPNPFFQILNIFAGKGISKVEITPEYIEFTIGLRLLSQSQDIKTCRLPLADIEKEMPEIIDSFAKSCGVPMGMIDFAGDFKEFPFGSTKSGNENNSDKDSPEDIHNNEIEEADETYQGFDNHRDESDWR